MLRHVTAARLMRHTLNMPKLGDSVSEVVILEWHVAPGRHGRRRRPAGAVETDKIDTDVPAPIAGTVVELLAEPQDEVATGRTIHRRRRLMPRTHVARDRRFGGRATGKR